MELGVVLARGVLAPRVSKPACSIKERRGKSFIGKTKTRNGRSFLIAPAAVIKISI